MAHLSGSWHRGGVAKASAQEDGARRLAARLEILYVDTPMTLQHLWLDARTIWRRTFGSERLRTWRAVFLLDLDKGIELMECRTCLLAGPDRVCRPCLLTRAVVYVRARTCGEAVRAAMQIAETLKKEGNL